MRSSIESIWFISSPHLLRENRDDAAVTIPPGLQVFRNEDEEITLQSESICSMYARQGLTLLYFVARNAPLSRFVCDTPQL